VEGLPEEESVANIHTVLYCILFMIRRYNVKFRALGDLLKLHHKPLLFGV